MRRYILRSVTRSTPAHRSQFTISPRFLHSSTPLLKRNNDSKVNSKLRNRQEREIENRFLEDSLEDAEEWPETNTHSASDLLETDPFEMDDFKRKLNDSLDRLRKDGSTIKQGRSDPELLRRLEVELPENLGGKLQ